MPFTYSMKSGFTSEKIFVIPFIEKYCARTCKVHISMHLIITCSTVNKLFPGRTTNTINMGGAGRGSGVNMIRRLGGARRLGVSNTIGLAGAGGIVSANPTGSRRLTVCPAGMVTRCQSQTPTGANSVESQRCVRGCMSLRCATGCVCPCVRSNQVAAGVGIQTRGLNSIGLDQVFADTAHQAGLVDHNVDLSANIDTLVNAGVVAGVSSNARTKTETVDVTIDVVNGGSTAAGNVDTGTGSLTDALGIVGFLYHNYPNA